MVRYWHWWSLHPCQDIIFSVVLLVEDLAPHESSYLRIIIYLFKSLAIGIIVVVESHNIEGGTSLILLTSLVHVSPHVDSVVLEFLMSFHGSKSIVFPMETLLSQIRNLGLLGLKSFLPHNLIGDVEVLVETLSLRDEVGGDWIRSEDLCRVDILMEVADPLLQTPILNRLLVFHGGPRRSGPWSDVIKVA